MLLLIKKKRNTTNRDDVLADQISREQEKHILELSEGVSAIKEISGAIKNRMIDDESLMADIDRGFDKNKNLMKTTVNKIDKVLTSASGNIMCYVFLFVVMVLTLLYKLTK